MTASRTLFLIRHGRSDFEATDMMETARGPQWDPPLGEVGREQAELLSRRLALLPPPTALYSSTFRRARETIAPYAARMGMVVSELEDLGEACIGAWEGLSFEQIIESDREMLRLFRNQEPMWRRAPGAEQLEALQARVISTVEDILARHPEGNVWIVAHGGVINAYLAPLLGLHDREMFFLPENTSINSVVVEGTERRVLFLSDVRHLNEAHLFDAE